MEATCEGGTVTAGGAVVAEADILSAGVGQSDGVLLLDNDKAKYIASNASDISDLIVSLCTIIEKVALIATGLDSVTLSPGGQTANIAALTALKVQLNLTKDGLK